MSKLSSNQFRRLLDALVQGFDEASMMIMLRTKLGKFLAAEADGNGTEELFANLINRAEARNWSLDLVRAASAFNPTAELTRLAAELAPQIALADIDHFNVCFVGSESVMINRKGLRQSLRTLSQSVPRGKRILVVNGPPVSGKTYSLEMITYLSEALGAFKVVPVNLQRIVGREVKPDDIAWEIVEVMNLPDDTVPPVDKEQDSRWSLRFCRRLAGRLNDLTTPWWLVIDGFNYVTLSQPVNDLIGELAVRISQTLPGLRMILLGYHDKLPLEAERATIYEEIGEIVQEDLFTFFFQIYYEHNLTHFPLDIARKVAEVWQVVDQKDARKLETLGEAAAKAAKSITGLEVAP